MAAITARRAACQDSAMELLPDDLLGVARHVIAHRRVAGPVLAADISDALALIRCARADADRMELALIRLARDMGRTWAEIAEAMNLGTPQGAMHRHLRLVDAEQSDGRRSEVEARRGRRGTGTEPTWLARHATRIEKTARLLVAAALPYPVAALDVDGMTDELAERHPSPGKLMGWISSLLGTVTENRSRALPPAKIWQQAHALVAGWDEARNIKAKTA